MTIPAPTESGDHRDSATSVFPWERKHGSRHRKSGDTPSESPPSGEETPPSCPVLTGTF